MKADRKVIDKEIRQKILLKLLTAVVLVCTVALAAAGMCTAETEEGATIGDGGDILFYIIVAALVIAVIAICVIFRRSKKFVVKERERMAEINKEVPPAKEIRVYDEEYVNQLAAEKRGAYGTASEDGGKSDDSNLK